MERILSLSFSKRKSELDLTWIDWQDDAARSPPYCNLLSYISKMLSKNCDFLDNKC